MRNVRLFGFCLAFGTNEFPTQADAFRCHREIVQPKRFGMPFRVHTHTHTQKRADCSMHRASDALCEHEHEHRVCWARDTWKRVAFWLDYSWRCCFCFGISSLVAMPVSAVYHTIQATHSLGTHSRRAQSCKRARWRVIIITFRRNSGLSSMGLGSAGAWQAKWIA